MRVVDPSGRTIVNLGEFDGINLRGAANGLLFPVSLVMSRGFLYVTNLAFDLRLFDLPQAVDSQWAAEVKRHHGLPGSRAPAAAAGL